MADLIDPSKVAIYIRWSTDDQSDGTTLEVQMEGCKAYVHSQGWLVTEDLIFVDDGYSGGNLDRPALNRLRKAVLVGDIQCVVVLKIDRLSRNVVDMVRLVIDEWDDLCYFKSAREAIDTTNHAGRMFFYTLTSFAEWERATIRERTMSGKLKRAQAGKNPGMKAPYGYESVDGTFHIVEPEAAVVRRIFQRYQMGQGLTSIAYGLNEDGIAHRHRPVWDKSEVHRVIQNPIYVGDFVYGGKTRNSRRGKQPNQTFWKKNETPLVVCTGIVPPIVSREVWNRVQAERQSRPNPHKGQSGRAFGSPYLLSGLLRCANCGHPMSGKNQKANNLKHYVCTGQHGLGQSVCDCGHLRVADLDNYVVTKFRQRYGQSAERAHALQDYLSSLTSEKAMLTQQMSPLQTEAQRLEGQLSKVRRDYRDGKLSIEELRLHEADLRADQRALGQQLEALERSIAGVEASLQSREMTMTIMESVDSWDELSIAQQKTVLRHFVSQVKAYRPRRTRDLACAITWRVSRASDPGGAERRGVVTVGV